jgi:hypothetical protein
MASDFANQMLTACVPGITDAEKMVDIGVTVLMLDKALKTPHFR